MFFRFAALLFSFTFSVSGLCYCLLHGDCYFPPEHFCFSSSLFTLITSVSLCICIVQNNSVARVMSRFVNLDSSILYFKNVLFFSGRSTLRECSLWCCSEAVSLHPVDIPGMVKQRLQIKLHFTLFPEGAQHVLNEICSVEAFCSLLGSPQRDENNPMFISERSF